MLARFVRLTGQTCPSSDRPMRINSYLTWLRANQQCKNGVCGLDFTENLLTKSSTGLTILHWWASSQHGRVVNQTITQRNAFTYIPAMDTKETGMTMNVTWQPDNGIGHHLSFARKISLEWPFMLIWVKIPFLGNLNLVGK